METTDFISREHESALELQDVTVAIDGKKILDHLSMTVTPGKVHALLGRNGAGKSTAFKTILNLLPMTEGQVHVFGERFREEHLRHIGASINGPALYGNLSARENLRVHTDILALPALEIDRVLQQVGLAGVGRKKAKNFSTGMKARLALAIAMLGNPEILMLDEPQNGLDPQGIADLRHFLRSWASRGGTVLVSSHQLGEVSRLADDISVLSDGRLIYTGTAEGFIEDGDLENRFLDTTGREIYSEGGQK